jgi:hypothetical protein
MDSDSLWFPVPDENAAIRDDLVVKNKIRVGMFQGKRMLPAPMPDRQWTDPARCRQPNTSTLNPDHCK